MILRGLLAMLAVLLSLGTAQGGKRVALVIGNSDYAQVPRLDNPVSDATAIAAAFRELEFDKVILATDLDYPGFRGAMAEFTQLADGADIAVLYFAGHGIEIGGRNYLIPVDAKLRDARVADFEAMPLDLAMATLEGAKQLRVVILDACRDNPFGARMRSTGATRSVGRGLARVDTPSNTLVAYAAKEGTTADDGDGRHSPFTEALLDQIQVPGVEVRLMFGRVRDAVLRRTYNRQEPFVYGAVGGREIYFKPGETKPVVAAAPPVPAPAPYVAAPPDREVIFWNSVKESRNAALLKTYVDRYPDGTFSGLASAMIEQIESAATGSGKRTVAALGDQATADPPDPAGPPEMVALARRYEIGDGYEQDHGKAARWYRKAARAGNPEAKYRLGLLYYHGRGVGQSFTEAAIQILDAVKAGHEPAVDMMETAESVSDPAFLKAAQQRLRAFDYYEGEIDGKWGDGSRNAVLALARGAPPETRERSEPRRKARTTVSTRPSRKAAPQKRRSSSKCVDDRNVYYGFEVFNTCKK